MERPRRLWDGYRRDDRRRTTRNAAMRRCAASPSQREGAPNPQHDLRRWTRRVDPKRVRRLLECLELTRQKLRPGIMSRPMRESLAQARLVRVQVDQSHSRACACRRERAAVLLLQGRASENDARVGGEGVLERVVYRGEPRRAIVVGEADTTTHLLHIRRRMEIVGVEEAPA